jgi:Fe-S-cluster containining protein
MASMKPGAGKILEKSAIEEVRAIYRELATRPVERNCTGRTECCQFKLTGRIPHLTRGEAMVAARGWRSTGRKALLSPASGVCPMLDEKNGKCMVYDSRPFGCRTHFCRAAGGNLERKDVIDLIRRLEKVDTELGGAGPRLLEDAVAAELEGML